MNKRTFLKTSFVLAGGTAMAGLAACTGGDAGSDTNANPEAKTVGQNGFELPPLPYAYDALESAIDEQTMRIHHDKHHAGYVSKLNDAVEGQPYAGMTLPQLMEAVQPGDTAVRNSGGGHYNHSLFWEVLGPAQTSPSGELGQAIASTFGSVENLKMQMNDAGKGVFGSGWSWLSVDDNGQLFVSSTPNQDNPAMRNIVERNGTPILGIDVWEHAYYLRYQNERGAYLDNIWKVINWPTVAARYAAAS